MLQKLSFEDDDDAAGQQFRPASYQEEAGQSHFLQPSYYWQLIKRRALYFVIPFILVLPVGLAAAILLPATYLSEGKILVQSQQIPTELVRPTVTSAAQERIQVIEQRTMTRENLLAIIDASLDSVRVYFLGDDEARKTEHHGVRKPLDPDGPLVV